MQCLIENKQMNAVKMAVIRRMLLPHLISGTFKFVLVAAKILNSIAGILRHGNIE